MTAYVDSLEREEPGMREGRPDEEMWLTAGDGDPRTALWLENARGRREEDGSFRLHAWSGVLSLAVPRRESAAPRQR